MPGVCLPVLSASLVCCVCCKHLKCVPLSSRRINTWILAALHCHRPIGVGSSDKRACGWRESGRLCFAQTLKLVCVCACVQLHQFRNPISARRIITRIPAPLHCHKPVGASVGGQARPWVAESNVILLRPNLCWETCKFSYTLVRGETVRIKTAVWISCTQSTDHMIMFE
jgi:hypothetical protein